MTVCKVFEILRSREHCMNKENLQITTMTQIICYLLNIFEPVDASECKKTHLAGVKNALTRKRAKAI